MEKRYLVWVIIEDVDGEGVEIHPAVELAGFRTLEEAELFQRELEQKYAAMASGEAPLLNEITVPRKNFDAWVRAVQGRAHQEIVRFASEHQSDLIVLGAHGLGDEKDSPLGTNTERTIRSASCPVLTIKPAKEK